MSQAREILEGLTEAQDKLTPDQVKEVKAEMVKNGVPVRFMKNGASLNIVTGETTSKGANIMYQVVYWNFTRETAKKIAGWLGVRTEFSESMAPLAEAAADLLSKFGEKDIRKLNDNPEWKKFVKGLPGSLGKVLGWFSKGDDLFIVGDKSYLMFSTKDLEHATVQGMFLKM